MTLPEYSITISPASMFLLQNRPRPWMGDLKKQQEKLTFQTIQAKLGTVGLQTLQATGCPLQGRLRRHRSSTVTRYQERH